MVKITFCMEHFVHADPLRRNEFQRALTGNLIMEDFDHVIIFSDEMQLSEAESQKVTIKPLGKRLEFSDFLKVANDPGRVYVLANADIEFVSGVDLFSHLPTNELWALTRWESDGSLWAGGRESQDAWAVRGRQWDDTLLKSCEIQLGWPGCENAFAGRLSEAGFRIRNYCHDIRCLHRHQETSRSYSETDRIARPYYFPDPEKMPFWIRLKSFFARKSQ